MGRPLLALHGTFGRGNVFDALAGRLSGVVTIDAPDQRGHGTCTRHASPLLDDYVRDAAEHALRIGEGRPVAVLGHSFGGVVAIHLAATRPDLVSALVIEDVGPVTGPPHVPTPVLDVRGWPRRAADRSALHTAIAARLGMDPTPLLVNAVDHTDHTELLIDWDDMMAVQHAGVGDHWTQWESGTAPALLLRATRGFMLTEALATEAALRRPGVEVLTIDSGHWIHDEAPGAMAAALTDFLTRTV